MGAGEGMRERVLAALAARGLLAEDGATTIYGQPSWRAVPPDDGPQGLMNASALQRRLVACAHATPATGIDQCATWVENVLASVGVPYICGNARAIYEGFCHATDLSGLFVGMVVAVGRHPFGVGGWTHGHVGLYVGDAHVMDCADGRVRTVPLAAWLSVYGVASEPRWGWLGGIGLG